MKNYSAKHFIGSLFSLFLCEHKSLKNELVQEMNLNRKFLLNSCCISALLEKSETIIFQVNLFILGTVNQRDFSCLIIFRSVSQLHCLPQCWLRINIYEYYLHDS